MKKHFLATITAGAVLLGATGSASAIVVDYDFEGSEFQTLYPTEGYTDAVNWTRSGVTLTVTAREVINDNHGNLTGSGISAPISGGVWIDHGTYYDGLGAKSYATDSEELLDGSSSTNANGEYIHDDGLLFSFASNVSLTFLNLGSFGSNDDFNLIVDGVRYLQDFDELESSAYVSNIVDDDKYYFTGVTGKEFLIWADGSSDEFLIDRITIRTVPEPATLLLLGIGLAGLTLRRQLAITRA